MFEGLFTIVSLLLIMFLIPSIAYHTIYPFLSSVLHYFLREYILPGIFLGYDVWEGILTLNSLSLGRLVLDEIDDLLPLPLSIKEITIKKAQINVSIWQLLSRIYHLKRGDPSLHSNEYIHIKLDGIVIDTSIIDQLEYALDEEKMRKILLKQKKAIIQYTVAMMEKGLRTYGIPQDKPSWIYDLLSDCVKRLVIQITDTSLTIHPSHTEDGKRNMHTMVLSIPSLQCKPLTLSDGGFEIILDECHVTSNAEDAMQLFGFKAEIIFPDMADFLSSMQYIGAPNETYKKITVKLGLEKAAFSISPFFIDSLTSYCIATIQYLSFVHYVEYKLGTSLTTTLPLEEKEAYMNSVCAFSSTPKQAPLALEAILDTKTIYELCENNFGWLKTWNNESKTRASWDTTSIISLDELISHFETVSLPFNCIELAFSLEDAEIVLTEDDISRCILTTKVIRVGINNVLYLPLTETPATSADRAVLTLSIENMAFSSCTKFQIINQPQLLFGNAETSDEAPLLSCKVNHSFNNSMSADITLSGLTFFALFEPIQELVLFFDRIESLCKESITAAVENDIFEVKPPNAVKLANASLHKALRTDSLSNERQVFAIFIPRVLQLKVAVEDFTIACVYKAENDRLLDVLALQSTAHFSAASKPNAEAAVLEIKNISLYPWAVNMEEWQSSGRPRSVFTCDSLMPTISGRIDYYLNIVKEKPKNRWIQNLFIELSEVSLSLSDLHLALLLHNLGLFSTLQISTPVQIELRKHRKAEANRRENESQLLLRMALVRRAIVPTLAVDGLVHPSSLRQVIQHMDSGRTLLRREVELLEKGILAEIGSAVMSLDELLVHLSRVLQSKIHQGRLNLQAYMYTAPQKEYNTDEAMITSSAFWAKLQEEAGITRDSLDGIHPKVAQKKLIRFLENYNLAQYVWEQCMEESTKAVWMIESEDFCDGISSFNHPSEFVLRQETTDLITPEQVPTIEDDINWDLSFSTKIGDMSLKTLDNILPRGLCRCAMSLRCIKLEGNLSTSSGCLEGQSIILQSSAKWNLILSFQLSAFVFTEKARGLEPVIEPWNVRCGFLGRAGEHGYEIIAETEERLQLNITESLVSYGSSLLSLMDDKFSDNDVDSMRTLTARAAVSKTFQITIRNATDIELKCSINKGTGKAVLPSKSSIFSSDTQSPTSLSIGIENWGSIEDVALDKSFALETFIPNFERRDSMIPLRVVVSKLGEKQATVVIDSNLYARNSTSHMIDLRMSNTEETVLSISPLQRIRLSPTILMGATEISIRLHGQQQWLSKIAIGSYLIGLERSLRRNSTRQISETQEESVETTDGQVVIKRFNAYFILCRRKVSFRAPEWEFQFLPKLVLYNLLPYPLELSMMEYRPQMTNAALSLAETGKIEAVLCKHKTTSSEGHKYMYSDEIMPGKSLEIVDAPCLKPLFFCLRLYNPKQDFYSPWSHAIQISWETPSIEEFKNASNASTNIILANGQRLLMNREMRDDGPRTIKFSVPYWIMNHTGLQMSYSTAVLPRVNQPVIISTSNFSDPSLVFLDKSILAIKPEKTKTSPPESWKEFGHSLLSDISPTESEIQNATWSQSVNASAVNTHGELNCGDMFFGVSVHRITSAPPHPSVTAVRILPRYIITNDTNCDLYVMPVAYPRETPFQFADALWIDATNVPSLSSKAFYSFHNLRNNSSDLSRNLLLGSEKIVTEERDRMYNARLWSSPLPIDNVGDFYCRIYHQQHGGLIILRLHIEIKEETIYLIIQESTAESPYKMENYTLSQVEYKIKGENTTETLLPASWHSLVWDDAGAAQHLVEVHVGNMPAQLYDLDRIGVQAEIGTEDTLFGNLTSERYQVRVYPSRHTRILQILPPGGENTLSEYRQEHRPMHLEGNSKHYSAAFINLHLLGIGISLYDSRPRELLFFSADSIRYKKPADSLSWTFSIFHLQLDNMLRGTKYPVIINPEDSGYSSRLSNNGTLQLQPFFAIEAESSKAELVKMYEKYEIVLCPFSVKLDVDFLYKTASFLEEYIVHRYDDIVVEILERDKLEKVLVNPFCHPEMTMDASESLLYFETFRVHSTEVNLEWVLRRGDLVSQVASSTLMQYIMSLVGLLGSNLSGSPSIYFGDIVVSQCFVSLEQLATILKENYSRQAVWQAYKVLGSSDLIGDPLGLVGNLGSGVIEFFKITKDELFGEAATRGEGVKFLGKTIVHTGASTAAKITGSLDRFVGELDNMTTTNGNGGGEGGSASPPLSNDSFQPFQGPVGFVKKLGQELTGIVTKPVEGIQKGGIGGLVQGTVQGVLGPGVVVLKALTATSHSLVSQVEAKMIDRGPFNGRRRQRKVFHDGLLLSDSDVRRKQPTSMTIQVILARELKLSNANTCALCCNVYIDGIQILHTRVMHATETPSWNEEKTIMLKPEYQEIKLEVCDSIAGVSVPIGVIKARLEDILEENKLRESQSTLSNWVKHGEPPVKEPIHVLELTDKMLEKNFMLYLPKIYELGYMQYRTEYVYIHVISASNLCRPGRLFDLLKTGLPIDPYVSVIIGDLRHSTSVIKGTENPKWENERFILPFIAEHEELPVIEFRVYDGNLMRDERLGTASLPIEERTGKEYDITLYSSQNTEIRGYLKVYLKVLTQEEAEQMSELSILKAGELVVAFDFS